MGKIKAIKVGVNPAVLQQTFSNMMSPLIEAHVSGDKSAPVACEAIVGRSGHLVVKLVIEPAGGFCGDLAEHEEVNAIGITEFSS